MNKLELTAQQKENELQRKVGDMVGREVYYCVSTLVYELAKIDEFMDDLMPVLSQDNWQSPAEENNIEVREDPEIPGAFQYSTEGSRNTSENWTPGEDEEELDRPQAWLDLDADSEQEAWREACEKEGIDEPYTDEAYEHWIVSDWLATKLEERGEMVLRDFLGLTIWGRGCTGQAIALDGVIREIYKAGPGKYDKD